MPITNQWWAFASTLVVHDRDEPGVYELGDSSGNVVYIGSSVEVRRRLNEHLAETGADAKKSATQYRLEYTTNYAARERQLYDQHVAAKGRAPLYNAKRP